MLYARNQDDDYHYIVIKLTRRANAGVSLDVICEIGRNRTAHQIRETTEKRTVIHERTYIWTDEQVRVETWVTRREEIQAHSIADKTGLVTEERRSYDQSNWKKRIIEHWPSACH